MFFVGRCVSPDATGAVLCEQFFKQTHTFFFFFLFVTVDQFIDWLES